MSKRQEHYLKENHRSETIHECVWYDCETRPETNADGVTRHVLVFGWACYRRRDKHGAWLAPQWKRFTEGKELWTWITNHSRRKVTLYVWAHNHSFDYSASFGMQSLSALGYSMKDAIVDSPPFIMTYTGKSCKLVLTDTLNIWRMSLAQMGKMVGLTKLAMPSEWVNPAADDVYCRRDVEIIMKAVCDWADFLRREDMGKFCLTVASQAMQTYRHRYMSERILVDTDKRALGIARSAYHGGRVECAYIGKLDGPLFLLDINSLYPYCMASFEFPLRLVAVTTQPSIVEVENILHRYACCARVTVNTRTAVVPIVEEGKLIFPVGRFDAYVSSPELKYLIEREELVQIQEVAVYEKGSPFIQFVQDLYGRRMAHKAAGEMVETGHYKLLLNSFSGKWGQNGIKWTTVGATDKDGIAFFCSADFFTDEVVSYRRFNHLIQRRDTDPESYNSHPAIAAHITAYGRMVLWTLIRQIPTKHYFYCDTDSVLVSKEGLKHVEQRISEEILGGLKVVGEYSHGVIYGPKDYILDGVRTLKGIRSQAVEIKPNTYRQDKWVGFRGALRKGWLDGPRTTQVVKTLTRRYSKGVVQRDGFTLPFHLPRS